MSNKNLRKSEIQDSDKLSKTMYLAGIYQEVKETINNCKEVVLLPGEVAFLAEAIAKRLGSTRLERI